MKGHPNQGANPLIRKLTVEAKWGQGTPQKYLWKLERPGPKGRRDVLVQDGRVVQTVGTPAQAKEWAAAYPGWDLVPA